MASDEEPIRTGIWLEEPEPDNPFAAAACYCRGYDVYADVLGRAGWAEYWYLLLRGERPQPWQARVLHDLAIALGNPGPRDASVRAAMNAGVGRSSVASRLMAAIGVGAGGYAGAQEVSRAMECFRDLGISPEGWVRQREQSRPERADIWPAPEHPPGFDPYGVSCATPVRRTLARLAGHCEASDAWLPRLETCRGELEEAAGAPLAMPGVSAAAFLDLDFGPEAAEAAYLILRLPGAAAHAQEQRELGPAKYPFFHGRLHRVSDGGAGP